VDELFSVRGRVVLATGAGHGIGRVLALAFAERGADVVLVSRTRRGTGGGRRRVPSAWRPGAAARGRRALGGRP